MDDDVLQATMQMQKAPTVTVEMPDGTTKVIRSDLLMLELINQNISAELLRDQDSMELKRLCYIVDDCMGQPVSCFDALNLYLVVSKQVGAIQKKTASTPGCEPVSDLAEAN